MIDHAPTYSAFRTPLAMAGIDFYDHHLVGLTWPYINCKGKQYHVTMLNQGWVCDCPGFNFYNKCKHITQVHEKVIAE